MQTRSVVDRLTGKRIVPVAVIDSVENAVPLARALAEAGLPVIEVTLRTPSALECVRAIRQHCPDVLVGAGTILDVSQVKAAIAAGAHFGVSPGTNDAVVKAARRQQWFFLPGVMTPSEVDKALGLGCSLQKFFPADKAGGPGMLKSLAGPDAHTGVRFVPLGGVSAVNMEEYLALPIVAAVGGSWVCDARLVAEKRWSDITALAKEAVARAARSKP